MKTTVILAMGGLVAGLNGEDAPVRLTRLEDIRN